MPVPNNHELFEFDPRVSVQMCNDRVDYDGDYSTSAAAHPTGSVSRRVVALQSDTAHLISTRVPGRGICFQQ